MRRVQEEEEELVSKNVKDDSVVVATFDIPAATQTLFANVPSGPALAWYHAHG